MLDSPGYAYGVPGWLSGRKMGKRRCADSEVTCRSSGQVSELGKELYLLENMLI